jgi:hypothetical protein
MWQIIWKRQVKTLLQISNLCQGKELSCDEKDFDDQLAKHSSFEPATALLAVRNSQNKDVEDEEEGEKEGGEEEGGEEAAGEQDISMKFRTGPSLHQ